VKRTPLLIALPVVILLLVGAYVLFMSPDRTSDTRGRMGVEVARTYADWEDYFGDEARRDVPRRKVVFIGIDGAVWSILDPMIEEGFLPTFAKLKREGSYGVLHSVKAYISPPAWVSMMTGYEPERTGIYTFGHWDREAREFLPLSAADTQTPSVWDIASHADKRTAVINVPMTYPVRDVNGIMVSGLMTPAKLHDRQRFNLTFTEHHAAPGDGELPVSHAPILSAELVHSANRFEFLLFDSLDDGGVGYDGVYMQNRRLESGRLAAGDAASGVFRIGRFSPWIKVNHLAPEKDETGWCKLIVMPDGQSANGYIVGFSHTLFATGDTDVVFTYPDTLADTLQERFGYYFPSSWLDKPIIPGFAADATKWASYFHQYDDWDLFLFVFTHTDNIQHLDGFSPLTRQVYKVLDGYLAQLLETLGDDTTLIIASDHGFKEYDISIDLNKVFQKLGLLTYASGTEIDHEKTLVFHNLWCVYFNHDLLDLDELRRRGIETPGGLTASEALKRHLRLAGKSLIGGDRGRPFPIEFIDLEPDAVAHAPDLIVEGTYTDYHIEFWNLRRPRDSVFRGLRPDEKWNHTLDGVVMAYGNGIRPGVELPPMEIADVTPTMLYLLGLPIPHDMDGRIMAEALDEEMVSGYPHYVIEDLGVLSRDEPISAEERETLERNLRSLGYIR